MDDICFSNINHLESFYDMMKRFVSLLGTNDEYGYLASHTSNSNSIEISITFTFSDIYQM